jgi:hypothetical protein
MPRYFYFFFIDFVEKETKKPNYNLTCFLSNFAQTPLCSIGFVIAIFFGIGFGRKKKRMNRTQKQ